MEKKTKIGTLQYHINIAIISTFGNQTAIGTLFNFGVRFGVTSGPQFYNQIG